MRSIKEALLERWQAQADAVDLAKVDPDIEYDPTNNSFLFLGDAEVSSHAFVLSLNPFANKYRIPIRSRTECLMRRMLKLKARVRMDKRFLAVQKRKAQRHGQILIPRRRTSHHRKQRREYECAYGACMICIIPGQMFRWKP
jgi:hypothetical protein